MAGWCHECRAEWWLDIDVCPDCGAALRPDEPPPMPDPEPEPDEPRDHEFVEIEFGDLDESTRWRIELTLDNAGVGFDWHGDTLRLPAAAVPLVDEVTGAGAGADEDGRPEGAPVDERDGRSSTGTASVTPATASRLAAAVLDGILATAIERWIAFALRIPTEANRYGYRFSWTGLVLGALAALGYHVVGTAVNGRTPGKMLAGIRVTGVDGRPPGLRAVIRYVAWAGFGYLAWIPMLRIPAIGWLAALAPWVTFASTLLRRDRRGWHDLLAGTVVVKARGPWRQ